MVLGSGEARHQGAEPGHLDRRGALGALGLIAVAALVGCETSPAPSGAGGPTPPAGSSTPTPTDSASAGGNLGPALEVSNGPRTVPAVALTFHGAGDPRLAESILAAAEQAAAAVTVLAVGTWLAAYPQMGDRTLSGGHELGNHTLNHRPMRTMDEPTAYAEIVGGQNLVRNYVTAPTWFRPSGTPHPTPEILAAAAQAGYATSLGFDVDPRDYEDPGPDAIVSRVLAAATAGSIVSLHLGHAGTAAAMPAILSGLNDMGLAPVTVSRLLAGVTP